MSMKENTQEKSLVMIKENSIFYKIKTFFRNLFHRGDTIVIKEPAIEENKFNEDSSKSKFIESLKNIEDEETKLLKLQKQYREGKIKEEDLTQEQIAALCDLYDKQLADIKKSNEIRRKRLIDYRLKMQTQN